MINKTSTNFYLDRIVGILFTIIQPLLGLIFSLRYIDKKWFQYVVVIFCTYFGYTMYVEDPIYDSSRYRDYFLNVYYVKDDYIKFLIDNINSIYVQDYFEATAAYLVSRFTNEYAVYFGFLGLLFGIIYSKNIYLVSQFVTKKSLLSIIFIYSFCFIFGPWAINGARFGTATQLFIFIVLSYFCYNKKKILLLLVILPLIHFSFLLPIFVLVTYVLFRKFIDKFHYLYLILFVGSFLLEFFVTNLISNLVQYFPDFLASKVISYTSFEAIKEVNSENSELTFLAKFADFSIKIYFLISYVYLYVYLKNNSSRLSKSDRLFINFFIYYATVFSIMAFLPSFSRYIDLSIIMSLIIFLKLIKDYSLIQKGNLFMLVIMTFFLLVYITKSIRYGFLFVGTEFFTSSPLFILIQD